MVTRPRSYPFASGIVLALAAILIASLLCWQPVFAAAPVRIGPVVLTIPEGFEAAQRQKQKGTLIAAWTRSVRDGSVKTLLQVTVYDLGSRTGKTPAQPDLADGPQKYLRQALGAMEQRRSRFKTSPVAHIKLADIPAVRASWNGAVATRDVVGVMYCVIVRNRFAVIFHTQDLGNIPTDGMLDAMKSIESVTLAGG
jgi:hypothetical protein